MDSELTSRIDILSEAQPHLALRGTVDVFLGRELLAAAKGALAADGDVHVDCSELERLDTSALQILLALQRQLAERSRALALLHVNEQVSAFVGFGGAERLLAPPPADLPRSVAPSQPAAVNSEAASVTAKSEDVLDDGWSHDGEKSEPEQIGSDAPHGLGANEPAPPSMEKTNE